VVRVSVTERVPSPKSVPRRLTFRPSPPIRESGHLPTDVGELTQREINVVGNISILSQLENYLSLTNQRETVIASNMANVDTPGYHTKDLDFQHALTNAMTTPTGSSPRPAVRDVNGLLERPDGNNVDIDREAMKLSEVQLQYQMGTQLMKDRFHQIMTAINEDQ
jgi:flagellar basal-body rod protein FlgB